MNIILKIKQKLSCGFWNIGIIKCSAREIISGKNNFEILWMKHRSKSKFYADPFPVGEDDKYYYILAEEYSYYTERGIIVKLTIKKNNMELVDREVVLDTGIHLSFPFPWDGGIIPEQYRSGKLYKYINGQEICVCEDAIIDPCFIEYKGKSFLFGTKVVDDPSDSNRKLFIYQLQGDKYFPIQDKPVKINIESARPAGKFFEVDGVLYRPAQDSSRIYGGQTRLMKVDQFDGEYKESEVRVISTSLEPCFNEGMHTFNVWNDIIIVDGFQTEYRGVQKLLYVLNRKLKLIK